MNNSPKTANKATVAFKAAGFLRLKGYTLKKNRIPVLAKKHFFQVFPHFHKGFSKDPYSILVKPT